MKHITLTTLLLVFVLTLSGCNVFFGERGGNGQKCFGDGTCNASMTCNDGICQPTTFVCSEEQVGCDGAWTTDCQSNKWLRITDCSVGDKICKDGNCSYIPIDGDADLELPNEACANNALRCVGTLKLLCEDSHWKAVTDCFDLGKVCEAGKCVAAPDGDAEELEADTELGAENDAEPELDADQDAEHENDAESVDASDGDPDADSDATVDADVEAEREIEKEAEVEIEAELEAEKEIEAEREAEIEIGTDCTTEPCCAGGYWLIENAGCVSGATVLSCTLEQCSATHTCLATRKPGFCVIDGACTADATPNPDNSCKLCDAAQNAWATKSVNEPCDDGAACTYNDYCDGTGHCVGTALSCPSAGSTCAEQSQCQGTSSCKTFTPGPETACDDHNACTYADACTGGGACKGTTISCSNDAGVCGTKRTCNGSNHCTEVRPGASIACETDGLACTDDFCDGTGDCAHTPKLGKCAIDGACYSDHDPNPANACQWCDATQNAWANKPTTEACDDGDPCTYDDRCNGSGSCGGTYLSCEDEPGPCGAKKACQGTSECKLTFPTTSTTCNDGAACTQNDVCNGLGGCGGTSYACGAGSPGTCEKVDTSTCNGEGTCAFTYTANTGAGCDDGNACTMNDLCAADKTCTGTTYTCNSHGTCKGDGSCTCDAAFDGAACDACKAGAYGTYPNCQIPSAAYCATSQCFKVPPTGNTKCFSVTAAITCPGAAGAWNCANTSCCGQDGQYADNTRTYTCYDAVGIATDCASLVLGENQVVTDSLTGLMWQRTFVTGLTPQLAKDYCDNLVYGGYSDWYLPSLLELSSLVDYSKSSPPVDTVVFSGWESVNIGGTLASSSTTRCIRNPSPYLGSGTFKRFYISDDTNVVTDVITGLVWQNSFLSKTTWLGALAYCESLTTSGYTDWRLPNVNELLSLSNYSKSNPSSDLVGMVGQTYWSSTPINLFSGYNGENNYPWSMTVNFSKGSIGYTKRYDANDYNGAAYYARCVRGGP